MNIEQQGDIARVMTGSSLSTPEILNSVSRISKSKKNKLCPIIDEMFKGEILPFGKDEALVKDVFSKIAISKNIDSAVLFWIYMEWLKNK